MARVFSQRTRQQGVGLIEVMVAILVLGVGVLGFAGLQARAMQSTGDSYMRSQAMAIAQDLAERVRLNRSAMGTYVTNTDWPTTAPTSTDTALLACSAATCTATEMATFDMNEIRYRAATMLGGGLVNMRTCQNTSASMPLRCIYVSWDGTLPTGGTGGQCANTGGTYAGNPNCIMLEVL